MDAILEEAYRRFAEYQQALQQRDLREPAAVILATANREGSPSCRVVLLRGVDERGFIFYTNSRSRKGRDLAENPRAALCFYDDAAAEQVRIDGDVEIVSDEQSDEYWQRRARGSRIGAWASQQSEVLLDRRDLDDAVARYEEQFAGVEEIPRPPHWFGYRIVPRRIEFWSGRPSRLHVRDIYEQQDDGWIKYQLYP